MNIFIEVNPNTRKILSISEGKNDSRYEWHEVNIPKPKTEEILSGDYNGFFRNGKIEVKETKEVKKEKNKKKLDKKISKIKKGKYNNKDLVDVINILRKHK